MSNYIKSEIKMVPITLENFLLAGSTSVDIDDGPATGPALSKGNNFFGSEEDDDDYDAPSRRPSSLWDD